MIGSDGGPSSQENKIISIRNPAAVVRSVGYNRYRQPIRKQLTVIKQYEYAESAYWRFISSGILTG